MNIDWSNAPDWADMYAQIVYKHETNAKDFAWICRDGYRVALPNDRRDDCWPYSPKTFEPDNFHIIEFRPALGHWTGEGLPPVGQGVCEYRGAHQWDEWTVVNIFATWGNGNQAQVFVDYGDGWRAERDPERFRIIRTPEQIIAEREREERIKAAQAWLEGISQEYGSEVADKCEDILMEAEERRKVLQ